MDKPQASRAPRQLEDGRWHVLTGSVPAIVIGVAVGLLVGGGLTLFQVLGIVTGVVLLVAVVARIEWGLLLLVFITHSNLSTVLVEHHGAPSIAKILVPLLILGIIIRLLGQHRRPDGWELPTLLIIIYAAVGASSLLYTEHLGETITALTDYLKNSIIAVIVVLLLQRAALLRGVIWALLASGILLGSVSTYQLLTSSFEHPYGGLALASIENIAGPLDDWRLAGSLGDPNFYAQYMLPILPLAIDRFRGERQRLLKLFAAWALLVALLTIVFTYSRGAFLAVVVMGALYVVLRPRRLWYAVPILLTTITLLQLAPQTHYAERISTLVDVIPVLGSGSTTDPAIRGRQSEMLVATDVFADHPFLGLGLGTYAAHYQDYAQQVFLDFRHRQREAHNLYLEILAETGLVGFFVFGAILWFMFRGLWRARRKAANAGLTELSGAITAIGIGMAGILTGYLFLHDAWPRFFWMFAGIAYSIPIIVRKELEKTGEYDRRVSVPDHARVRQC